MRQPPGEPLVLVARRAQATRPCRARDAARHRRFTAARRRSGVENTQHTTIFVAPEGYANGNFAWSAADETFINDMLKLFEGDLCIDTSRVFSVGFSFGAIFSYTLACDMPSVFRAVATLEAAPITGCKDGKTPVAYLGIEGLQDPTCTPAMARQCRDTFVGANGCTVPPSGAGRGLEFLHPVLTARSALR